MRKSVVLILFIFLSTFIYPAKTLWWETLVYSDDGKKGKVKESIMRSYKFEEKFGKKIKILALKMISRYNKKGHKIEIGEGSDVEKCYYKYDNRGNATEVTWYNTDETIRIKKILKYDNHGNMITLEDYYGNGALDTKTICKYDSQNNEIERVEYDGNGTLKSKYLYKYDNRRNIIEEASYNGDGKLKYKSLYKYDAQNNMIEEKSDLYPKK